MPRHHHVACLVVLTAIPAGAAEVEAEPFTAPSWLHIESRVSPALQRKHREEQQLERMRRERAALDVRDALERQPRAEALVKLPEFRAACGDGDAPMVPDILDDTGAPVKELLQPSEVCARFTGTSADLSGLRDTLSRSDNAFVKAHPTTFRPLCDRDGYPLVGNIVQGKGASEVRTVGTYCTELRAALHDNHAAKADKS